MLAAPEQTRGDLAADRARERESIAFSPPGYFRFVQPSDTSGA